MIPGMTEMLNKQTKAGARRERNASDTAVTSEGMPGDATCVECGETFPRNTMYISEKGEVCAEHFTG